MTARTLWLILLLCASGTATAAGSGKAVYERWCAGCHADSPFAPGTIHLKTVREPGKVLIEGRTDLPAEYVRTMVRKGYAGMPSFRRTEIDESELEALVDYLTGNGS